jgi:hypothetical protein
VVGPPMMVPADLDRAGLERCRERTERLMNCLTSEAEAWAVAGTRKTGETPIVAQIAPPPRIELATQEIATPTKRFLAA